MKIQKINKNLLDTYYQKLDNICYVTDSYIAYKLPSNEFMLDPEKLKSEVSPVLVYEKGIIGGLIMPMRRY